MFLDYISGMKVVKERVFKNYFLIGNELFQKNSLRDQIKNIFFSKKYHTRFYECNEQTYTEVLKEIINYNLFEDKKLIEINIEKCKTKEEILHIVEKSSDSFIIMFDFLNRRELKNDYFTRIKKDTLCIDVGPINKIQHFNIVRNEIKNSIPEISISEHTIRLISETTEGNLYRISEIIFLLKNQNIKKIDENDISNFLEDQRNETIISFRTKIIKKDKKSSLLILEKLIKKNIDFSFILWCLLKDIRLIILLKESDTSSYGAIFSNNNIWIRQQIDYIDLVKNFTIEKCKILMKICLEIDLSIKGISKHNIKMLFIKYILLFTL